MVLLFVLIATRYDSKAATRIIVQQCSTCRIKTKWAASCVLASSIETQPRQVPWESVITFLRMIICKRIKVSAIYPNRYIDLSICMNKVTQNGKFNLLCDIKNRQLFLCSVCLVECILRAHVPRFSAKLNIIR